LGKRQKQVLKMGILILAIAVLVSGLIVLIVAE